MESAARLLQAAVDHIRSSDAVFVVGAGASFQSGMPLAGQLAPLVCHTLDTHPAAGQRVCEQLGVRQGSAKDVIGHVWERLLTGFAVIAAYPEAWATFQACFAGLNRERSSIPSPAHAALARLVHCGSAVQVISLNWDTLLEVAFLDLYGIDINSHGTKLWKPHGDCQRPDILWVLPHQPGLIPSELVDRVTSIANERPRTLVVVGYSEGDEVVVERLIKPLSDRWTVIRIGPNAAGEGAIRATAREALEYLAEGLCPVSEPTGWQHVTFKNQRGIEAAVSGERLGPRDVDSCPRLPHFLAAARALELLQAVEIAGSPGCGKSLTAWQLARELNREGWEVLRPDPAIAPLKAMSLTPIPSSLWRRILVIDDSQIYPNGFADQLIEQAGSSLKVIRATTDAEGERSHAVRIPAAAAVEVMASDFRKRRTELLPIVARFDPRVGDEYLDVPIERRIDEAGEAATPWQFSFVLRGGWRQARDELRVLRDFERADLLLIIVAAHQLLTLDAGCSADDVIRSSSHLGRQEPWVRSGLELLRRRKQLLHASTLRCVHIQSAVVALESFFANREDAEFTLTVSMLRALFARPDTPLRGVSWLLRTVYRSDAFRHTGGTQWDVLTADLVEKLVNRCFSATLPQEKRDATFILNTLVGHKSLPIGALEPYLPILGKWLETADGTTAYALGDLTNTLWYPERSEKSLASRLVASVNPAQVTNSLSTITWDQGYSWGFLLGRLWVVASKEWRATLKYTIPRDQILSLIETLKTTEVTDFNHLLSGLGSYDRDFVTDLLKRAIPVIRRRFEEAPLEAFAETNETRWGLLGADLFGRTRPSADQKKLSKQMTRSIRPRSVADGILTCRHGDWEPYSELLSWLRAIDPTTHRDIAQAIDWKAFEERVAPMWSKPQGGPWFLLYSLMVDRNGHPVRTWLATQAGRMTEISPMLAGCSPEAAISVVRNRGHISPVTSHNLRFQAWSLDRLATVDRELALSYMEANRIAIASLLTNLEGIDCEHFPTLLRLLEKLDREFLRRLFANVDPVVASEHWLKHRRDNRKEVRVGARKIYVIAREHGEGGIRALAERLLASGKRASPTNRDDPTAKPGGPT